MTTKERILKPVKAIKFRKVWSSESGLTRVIEVTDSDFIKKFCESIESAEHATFHTGSTPKSSRYLFEVVGEETYAGQLYPDRAILDREVLHLKDKNLWNLVENYLIALK